MVIALAIQKKQRMKLVQVCLMGVGGLWYLVVSFVFRKFAPIKDQNQLLSDTLLLIEYLKLRATFLTQKRRRVTSTLNKASFFNIKLTKARDSPKHYLPP
jgi:hypothetical protein